MGRGLEPHREQALAVGREQRPGREIGAHPGDLRTPRRVCASGSAQRLGGGSTGTSARYRTALTWDFAAPHGLVACERHALPLA